MRALRGWVPRVLDGRLNIWQLGGLALGIMCIFSPRGVWGAAVIEQSDLTITPIGTIAAGPPSQMVFGPDGRLYTTLVTGGTTTSPSVASYAYSPTGNLSDAKTVISTGGAVGIGFGPVSLGAYGAVGSTSTTGMYLTDQQKSGVSNLRVIPEAGGTFSGTGTVIVQNIQSGYHQADQIVVKNNSDGTSSLYVGIGTRTKDGVTNYPNATNGRDTAYSGTISWIQDMKQVNGSVTDSAGFGYNGVYTTNASPDYSITGPYTSTAVNKLIVQSSGTRNPYGLALDGSGNLWFSNNFNRSVSDNSFNGTINPATGNLYGITQGDPTSTDFTNSAYDQLFKVQAKGDYGYNNSNWRNDAANDNPSVVSNAAYNAGFFHLNNLVRSTTFDNLNHLAGQSSFQLYSQSNPNDIVGLGPNSSSDGMAFYTGSSFASRYQGDDFIARENNSSSDLSGHTLTYGDVIAVNPTTGIGMEIATGLDNPVDVIQDGYGNLLVADYGDSTIYRISAVPEPGSTAMLAAVGLAALLMKGRRRIDGNWRQVL